MSTSIEKCVEDFLFHCEFEKNLSAKTIKAYKIDLAQFKDYIACNVSSPVQVGEIDKDILRGYVKKLYAGFKEKTIKRKINVIKVFFNFLERDERIEKNPFRKLQVRIHETRTLPRVISLGQIEAVLKFMYAEKKGQAPKGIHGRFYLLRDICIVEFLFMTGARVSEIASLKKENISLKDSAFKILGKGRRERLAHLFGAGMHETLQEYDALRDRLFPGRADFFVNRLGARVSEQSVRFMIRKYFRRAGIDRHITPHMFRHTFATSLLEQGVDIRQIQEMLGHSSILTTQIYTHVAAAGQHKILETKHPRNSFQL